MNWALIVVLAGSPILTDARFASFEECMAAEAQMSVAYARRTNMLRDALKPGEAYETRLRERTPWGACVPAATTAASPRP